MAKSKSSKPEFYKCFMQKGFFPNANKITKYEESSNYWIFKTGESVYKVKKKEKVQSTFIYEELFCNEIIDQINSHSPGLKPKIGYVEKEDNAYIINDSATNTDNILYYILIMRQLPDRHFLDNILKKSKLNERILDQVCQTLANYHNDARLSDLKDEGTPDKIGAYLADLFYQSKKFLGTTISQAVIDITQRPMDKFLKNNKKLFLRRIRNERIRHVHGCFIPRKIHVHKNNTLFLARTTDPLKDRFADVAADIADLTIELQRYGGAHLADYFSEKYSDVTGDLEQKQVLAFYQVLKCLSNGLKHNLGMERVAKGESSDHQKSAKAYYEQAIDVVRHL